ncbi:MAG: cupin domain-containing protein [Pseudomonadota bacterium]
MKIIQHLPAATLIGSLIFMGFAGATIASEPPVIVPLDLSEEPELSGQFPRSFREGDFDGKYLYKKLYAARENPNNRSGIWEGGPGVLVIESYRINEYVELLSGTLTTVDDNGMRRTFGSEDRFIIPKGWKGRWEMETRIRKHYLTF